VYLVEWGLRVRLPPINASPPSGGFKKGEGAAGAVASILCQNFSITRLFRIKGMHIDRCVHLRLMTTRLHNIVLRIRAFFSTFLDPPQPPPLCSKLRSSFDTLCQTPSDVISGSGGFKEGVGAPPPHWLIFFSRKKPFFSCTGNIFRCAHL